MPDTHHTIVAQYLERVERSADRVALFTPEGETFRSRTWREVDDDVRRATAALIKLGVEPGDRVVLVSRNRYEWVVADLAIQLAGAANVPIHAALSGAQIAWQIVDSGAKVVLLAGAEQVEKLTPQAEKIPDSVSIATFDEVASWPGRTFERWSELLRSSEPAKSTAAVKPDDLATIIYTSGTTGEPKGVMLSQSNLASNAIASLSAFGESQNDTRLSWLPWSHIFARTCDLYTWIAGGSQLAVAETPETVVAACKMIRPTMLNGVPYFFDKVLRSLVEKGVADQPEVLQNVFGGRLRACISGGAPLPDHVAEFYQQRGIALVQGYGLTETSPVITTGTLAAFRNGTVGRALPGVEVRIADDGEIVTRGPHVMLGYWKRPDATAETIRDGWLHTGDLGEIDADGFLKITGRKKELIVTAAGRNIAPTYLEALLTADELIEQALVIGDRQKYLTALIVPNPAALRAAIISQGIPVTSAAEALVHPRVRELYEGVVRRRLADVSQYEQICNFTILGRGFTVESGELTPTLKLRRPAIHANFAAEIAAMYV